MKEPERMKEAQSILDSWIEEIIAGLPPHHKVLPEPARDAIITEALVKRYDRAMAEGGRDREALIKHWVHDQVDKFLASKEPRGQYDPGAMLCLDGNRYVSMDKATKEHVQQWRDYMALEPEQGCNYGNIQYAEARLALWDDEKTLAELEAAP